MTTKTTTEQPAPFLAEIARRVTAGAADDRERAVAIHDFVRDRVRYGFTPRFDLASPAETLAAGLGHCNPQTSLFVALLRAVGVEAQFHYVTLSGEILRGVLPTAPALISHGFAEVRLEGRWVKVDSYIVDREHAAGALARLREEGREVGHGFHLRGRTSWDGRGDSFGQLADWSMVVEDHGTFERAEDFLTSSASRHRLGPLSFTALLSALPSPFFGAFTRVVDGRIARLRQAGPARPALSPLAQAA